MCIRSASSPSTVLWAFHTIQPSSFRLYSCVSCVFHTAEMCVCWHSLLKGYLLTYLRLQWAHEASWCLGKRSCCPSPDSDCDHHGCPSGLWFISPYTIINFTRLSVVQVTVAAALAGWPVILTGWPAGRSRWAWSKWAVSASHEQTLSSTGARVGWLGVVTGISAASIGGFLVQFTTTRHENPMSTAENFIITSALTILHTCWITAYQNSRWYWMLLMPSDRQPDNKTNDHNASSSVLLKLL